MELRSSHNRSFLALLGSSILLPSLKLITNPVVKHSLKIWAKLRKHFGLHSFSLLSPNASNFLFKPSCQHSAFQEWGRKGIVRFKALFIDNSLASFEQLSKKFNLPVSNFFRYLQARHFVLSQMSESVTTVNLTFVDIFLSTGPLKKKLISAFIARCQIWRVPRQSQKSMGGRLGSSFTSGNLGLHTKVGYFNLALCTPLFNSIQNST